MNTLWLNVILLTAGLLRPIFAGDGIDWKRLKKPALDEECGIYAAIVHKQHNSTNNNAANLKLQGSVEHAHSDRLFGQRNWPWMAIIRNNSDFLCNGILIRKNYILTTASCIDNKKPSKIVADLKGKIFKIKGFHQHKGYDKTRPNKMAGDIALIELSESAPVEDEKSGIMSICLPRSALQPLHAQECAISYIWETDKERKKFEMDTAARLEEHDRCKGEDTNVDGSINLLNCVSSKERDRPFQSKKGQVVYFLTCKTSGYWSVFGLSKFHAVAKKKTEKRQFTYYVTLVRYLTWAKDIIYNRKPTSLS